MLRFREADVRDRQLRVASGSSTNEPLWNAYQSLKADRSALTAKWRPGTLGGGGRQTRPFATTQESVRIFGHFCIADPEDSTPLRDLSELVVFNSTAAQPLDRSERRATPECIRLLPQPRSAARQRQNM